MTSHKGFRNQQGGDLMKHRNTAFSVAILFILLGASDAYAFAAKDVTKCNPLFLGNAIPNDNKDDSLAIQTCLNNAGSEAAIYFPPGVYDFATGLTVSQNQVTLYS